MSGGLTLVPSYATDLEYPSYSDRLLMKSLGVQAGVVEENDFKVTVGSGLQVEVEKGKAFVEQTKAKQELSNTFYNGLYNLLNPTKQNPYNSVTVPTTNPQIAQIILRVYDVEELGTTGSSFGRIEWLNGTPNAGATKAHIEEGKAGEFGAAALPTSSLRLCYVVVPKNATVSSEYTLVDERPRSQKINKESIVDENIVSGRALIATGNSYSERVERVTNTVYTPNTSRFTYAMIYAEKSEGLEMQVWVGAKATEESESLCKLNSFPEAGKFGRVAVGFLLPPGQKWRVGTSGKIFSSYLFL